MPNGLARPVTLQFEIDIGGDQQAQWSQGGRGGPCGGLGGGGQARGQLLPGGLDAAMELGRKLGDQFEQPVIHSQSTQLSPQFSTAGVQVPASVEGDLLGQVRAGLERQGVLPPPLGRKFQLAIIQAMFERGFPVGGIDPQLHRQAVHGPLWQQPLRGRNGGELRVAPDPVGVPLQPQPWTLQFNPADAGIFIRDPALVDGHHHLVDLQQAGIVLAHPNPHAMGVNASLEVEAGPGHCDLPAGQEPTGLLQQLGPQQFVTVVPDVIGVRSPNGGARDQHQQQDEQGLVHAAGLPHASRGGRTPRGTSDQQPDRRGNQQRVLGGKPVADRPNEHAVHQ